MAAPNLVNVATITAKSVQATLDTTLTTEILANASSSGKVDYFCGLVGGFGLTTSFF